MEDAVHFPGYVAAADLPVLYSAATMAAMPSEYEGFGLPVLEAMACGTPVVCSNTSSLPEVAGDSALLVDPQSPDELSEAMIRVFGEERLREEMVDRGLVQAAGFNWERSARQLLGVIDSLGEMSRRAPEGRV
jgi:glycosyltransferase involved in cell wall biosynthesis